MIGVRIVIITVLSIVWPLACSLALPGGIAGPRKIATSGVAIRLSTIHATITRRA